MKRTVKPLTKNDLTKVLQKFATKDDLQKFATKDDLQKFATKDDLVTFKDVILKEIKDMRDEVAIVTGYRDKIEDHEERIEKVEKHLHIQPA